jgi:hypothetical protein
LKNLSISLTWVLDLFIVKANSPSLIIKIPRAAAFNHIKLNYIFYLEFEAVSEVAGFEDSAIFFVGSAEVMNQIFGINVTQRGN